MNQGAYRFLCDENVNRKAVEAMRQRGIDAMHVLDLGMMSAADSVIMALAIREGRILITRDYSDFGAQVVHQVMRDREFPGVLLISPSIPEGDVGALLHAVEDWIRHCESTGHSIRNSAGWLTLPLKDNGFDRRVREATEPYRAVLERVSCAEC